MTRLVRTEQLRRERAAVHAAHGRVAALVAGGAASADVFAEVAREVGEVIGMPLVTLWRYERDRRAVVLGAWSERPHPFDAGTSWPLDGPAICSQVLDTGRAARIDDLAGLRSTIADAARKTGIRACAGAPITVDGDVWGALSADMTDGEPLPDRVEDRLMEFTALVASAISNTASREQLARLADEHAALRRVATLVAQGIPPPEVFAAVAREVGLLLGVEWVHMARYEPDGTSIGVAGWSPAGDQIPVGTRVELAGDSVGGRVLQTGRPARMEDYETASGAAAAMGRARGLRSSVGAPIVVDQRLWGMMMAASKGDRRLPDDTELRIAAFTELVATAISNTEARTELRQLAEEQAALRRVATLVAQAVPPDEVFAAVAEEVARVLPVEHAAMARYEPDGTMTVVAASAGVRDRFPVGGRWTLGGNTVSSVVMETGRAARIDSYAAAPGALAAAIRERGLHSGVGAPIVVDGRLWGVMTASSSDQPLPADTEARVELFTELVATAIANAHARAALAASRARVVTAADETRRRIERDLHDGTQQRLVSLLLELRMMEATMPSDVDELREQLARTAQGLGGMLEELREIAHGIHPAILTQGGLSRALSALARRSPVRVELDLRAEGRLPEPVEVAAYYVVSESLTNVAKHAHASVVNVELDTQDSILRLAIRDDGVGGADRARGSGLVGLSDRVEALGGTLEVSSPPGGGTTVVIEVPVEGGRIADPQLKP